MSSTETASANTPDSTATTNVPKTNEVRFTVDDFLFTEKLGEGAYSQVMLAKYKKTGKFYATKVVEKAFILREGKTKTVKVEKDVLHRMNHPNIIKLFCTFQDKERLYFALELAPGGELFSYIRDYGTISYEATQFYAAEIVNALEYMHGMGIIHRDLKPENVLLSKDMHVKLTDFGTAKIVNSDGTSEGVANDTVLKRKPKNTFVGTAEYVSPEILKDEPCNEGADLWALGCIIYQCLTGKHPFKAESEYLIFQKILKRELIFPSNFPAQAKDLVDKLLQLEQNKRLGTPDNGGYSALKTHPFFSGIDFEDLKNQVPPPLKKDSSKKLKDGIDFSSLPSPSSFISQKPKEESQTPRSTTDSPTPRPHPSGNFTRTASSSNMFSSTSETELLEENSELWKQFLMKNENIFYSKPVIKRRRMTAKRRQLVLTDKPRLMYIDPSKMAIKGTIPWSSSLKVIPKNDRDFIIQTPGRSYVLEDLSNNVKGWMDAIESLKKQLAGEK